MTASDRDRPVGLELLADAFERIRDSVHDVLDGVSADQLGRRPGGQGNSIAWLVWHLTRIQDDHVAGLASTEQVWTSSGWAKRFDLPLDESDTGYGHSDADVAALSGAQAELLRGYYDAVAERTAQIVAGLSEADLARVVDDRWDPPVTCAVRLVSVIADDLQHVGQAAYARGLP